MAITLGILGVVVAAIFVGNATLYKGALGGGKDGPDGKRSAADTSHCEKLKKPARPFWGKPRQDYIDCLQEEKRRRPLTISPAEGTAIDLTVTNVTSNSLGIEAILCNKGPGSFIGSFFVTLNLSAIGANPSSGTNYDGEFILPNAAPFLAGECRTHQWPNDTLRALNITPGAYNALVTIDSHNQVAETDETNNSSAARVTVQTVQQATLSVAANTSFGSQAILPNTAGAKVGSFILSAGLGGDIMLSSIKLQRIGFMANSDLKSIILKRVDSIRGEYEVGQLYSLAADGSATFSNVGGGGITIRAGANEVFNIYASIALSTPVGSTIRFAINANEIVGFTASGVRITAPNTQVQLQEMQVVGATKPTLAKSPASPLNLNINTGFSGVIGVWNVQTGTSAFELRNVCIGLPRPRGSVTPWGEIHNYISTIRVLIDDGVGGAEQVIFSRTPTAADVNDNCMLGNYHSLTQNPTIPSNARKQIKLVADFYPASHWPGQIMPVDHFSFVPVLGLSGGLGGSAATLYNTDPAYVEGNNVRYWANNPILVLNDNGATPNPFSPSRGETTTISYYALQDLLSGLQIRVGTGGAIGMLIKTIYSTRSFVQEGDHSAVWDGKDELGNIVRAGVYGYSYIYNGAVIASGTVTVN